MEFEEEFCYPNVIDFFGTTPCHLCDFTIRDLEKYASYDKYAEGNIEKSNLFVSEQIDHLLERNHKNNHEGIIESFSTEFQEFEDIFPSIHRKSLVIALYNFTEHQIKTLCEAINKLLPPGMSRKYFRDVSIKNYRKFLRSEAGFSINQGQKLWGLWEELLKVEQIRHLLVHSEGEIEEHRVGLKLDLENYCKQKKGIRVYGNSIIIDKGFIKSLIADLISLFELLDRQVHAFIKRYENVHGRYVDSLS